MILSFKVRTMKTSLQIDESVKDPLATLATNWKAIIVLTGPLWEW